MISGIAIIINNILVIGILYDICKNIDRIYHNCARAAAAVDNIFYFDDFSRILCMLTVYRFTYNNGRAADADKQKPFHSYSVVHFVEMHQPFSFTLFCTCVCFDPVICLLSGVFQLTCFGLQNVKLIVSKVNRTDQCDMHF